MRKLRSETKERLNSALVDPKYFEISEIGKSGKLQRKPQLNIEIAFKIAANVNCIKSRLCERPLTKSVFILHELFAIYRVLMVYCSV